MPRGAVLGMITSGLGFGGPGVAIPWSLGVADRAKPLASTARCRAAISASAASRWRCRSAAKDVAGGQERGLLVVQVADGGPAAQAGFLQGDILIRLDGTSVTNADDLQGLLGPQSRRLERHRLGGAWWRAEGPERYGRYPGVASADHRRHSTRRCRASASAWPRCWPSTVTPCWPRRRPTTPRSGSWTSRPRPTSTR